MADLEGLWGPALDTLREWDPAWAEACHAMSVHPWRTGVLDDRFIALVCVGLSVACTNLDDTASRRHIRAALDAGATRDEILFVIKCASVVAVHSMSVAAPLLMAGLGGAVTDGPPDDVPPAPSCDAVRAGGQWNEAWNPFLELDPAWTERFMAVGLGIYATDLFSPREIELLSIALDATVTHLYAPGVLRHVHAALAAGASRAEILTVLQLCVSQGVQSANLAVPILADELTRSQ